MEEALPAPSEDVVTVEEVEARFPELQEQQKSDDGLPVCRVFEHFNAFFLVSPAPRDDPLFLGPANFTEECLQLIARSERTSELMLFSLARLELGGEELLCFGGPYSQARDKRLGPSRQRDISGRPADWLPTRGAATMVCAFQGGPSHAALLHGEGPCGSRHYASWTCCAGDASCGEVGSRPSLEGLQGDAAVVESKLFEARVPRDWVTFQHIGMLFAQIAERQSSPKEFVRASAQASRWMELAHEIVDDDSLVRFYQKHQMRHGDALYHASPRRSLPWPAANATPVVVLLTVFGKYGRHCRATLYSLLVHSSVPVVALLAGDTVGVEDARSSLKGIRTWAKQSLLQKVLYFDISVSSHAFRDAWEQLPPEFRERSAAGKEGLTKGGFDASDWARLFLDTYVPPWVEKVLYIDVGDVLVLGDVAELWSAFDRIKAGQLFGAARMPWQLKEYKQWRRRYNVSFVAEGFGFNSGVLLLHVGRMRQANFARALIASVWAAVQIYRDHGQKMRMMDIMNLHLGRNPQQFFKIPCEWNYMPKPPFEGRWGAPIVWPAGVWHSMISHPGLLAADHVEHRCPGKAELFASGVDVPEAAPGSYQLEHQDLRGCRCGERARLLHAAGAIKMRPWVSYLLGHWGVPCVAETASVLSWQQHGHGGQELFAPSPS